MRIAITPIFLQHFGRLVRAISGTDCRPEWRRRGKAVRQGRRGRARERRSWSLGRVFGARAGGAPRDNLRRHRRGRSTHGRRDRVARRATRQILRRDRKSTRLNSSHLVISYAVFCLKKKKKKYDLTSSMTY